MIHQPSGGSQGQASDIELAKEILYLRETKHILADHTRKTVEEVARDTERDHL